MKELSTKEKMVNAASTLFFQKGFHGTSVRDIANKAAVNVSLISYYFKSKQGLLEHAVTHYYEAYLEMMQETITSSEKGAPLQTLKGLILHMLHFRMDHYQLSAFIQRELSLDSTFVREMTVTYLAKEDYIFRNLFYDILPKSKKRRQNILYMQLKGMIMSPFSLRVEWDTTLVDKVSRKQFVKRYGATMEEWLDYLVNH